MPAMVADVEADATRLRIIREAEVARLDASPSRRPGEVSSWLLGRASARDQDHAEAGLALHHPRVGVDGLFERNGLDHRTNTLQHAEAKRVLAVDRRAGQAAVDRTSAE